MSPLSTADILRENSTSDINSITTLTFTHKSLSNVSCLSEFKNLERLDLTFNNLSSLHGLEGCVNLKWLNVQQNKLVTLKGIESLPNLNVLNAAKNKLRTMEEVKDIVKLNALILNDNEISSISGLDRLTALNTLVLSRNPISKMGNSLDKLKLIKKVSLSNCQLEAIDLSIKACTELQELRLAHNDIKTLPVELAYNKRLHILDVGNNMISRWSELEVLSSLNYLKNLNLLGNPIAEKAKLLKKIKKLVPRLQIFNSKRMDRLNLVEENQKAGQALAGVGDDLDPPKKKKKDHGEMDVDSDKYANHKALKKDLKHENGRELQDSTNNTIQHKFGKKRKGDVQSTTLSNEEYHPEAERDHKKKQKNSQECAVSQDFEVEPDVETGLKKSKKKQKHIENDSPVQEAHRTKTDKKSKRKAEKVGLDAIDDKEVSFAELLTCETSGKVKSSDGKRRDNTVGIIDSTAPLVTYPVKTKKTKNQGAGASVFEVLAPPPEIGLGGPSAWDV